MSLVALDFRPCIPHTEDAQPAGMRQGSTGVMGAMKSPTADRRRWMIATSGSGVGRLALDFALWMEGVNVLVFLVLHACSVYHYPSQCFQPHKYVAVYALVCCSSEIRKIVVAARAAAVAGVLQHLVFR